jgi:lipid-A-disaccharide synthase
LIDTVDFARNSENTFVSTDANKTIIALLPGSRKQEIKAILKRMLSIVSDFPDYQFVVAAAPSVPIELYKNILKENDSVILLENQTYPLLKAAQAALVTSGTATLETALFEVPQVVCYKTGPIFYWIVRQIIKIPFISLVNIIMGRKIVEELIQGKLNRNNLKKELHKILDTEQRKYILADYAELKKKLGEKGAAERASKLIISSLRKN